MTRAAVDQLLYLLDDAFEGVGERDGDREHALLHNLRDITEQEWRWHPIGGERSIGSIVGHVAWAKYIYADAGFGEGKVDGRTLRPASAGPRPTMAEVIDWLREGHRTFRACVERLTDDDLLTPRRTNWGEMKETRWLIAVIIEHDVYHGGEINHIRALSRKDDRWPYEPEP